MDLNGPGVTRRCSFKSKMFLSEITKADHDKCCQYFGDGGIEMKLLHKQLDEGVV